MKTLSEPSFHVGKIPIYGNLILAPMDGITDLPFRSLTRQLGSAMSYTEFINAIEVVHHNSRLEKRNQFLPLERPIVFQIYDDNPDRLLAAALILRKLSPDIIDINMGCSARTVTHRGAGAGLLREPEKIGVIFRLLKNELDIPITGKIRLGWDDTNRNYIDVAQTIEENGGSMIAVHARTRKQEYLGEADWDAIAEIKQSVRIPVIGNGDVRTVEDIDRIQQITQCDGVMIGRAAISNPWIFSYKNRDQVEISEVKKTIHQHLLSSIEFYGWQYGVILFRKFLKRYLGPYQFQKDKISKLMVIENHSDLMLAIEDLFHGLDFPPNLL